MRTDLQLERLLVDVDTLIRHNDVRLLAYRSRENEHSGGRGGSARREGGELCGKVHGAAIDTITHGQWPIVEGTTSTAGEQGGVR